MKHLPYTAHSFFTLVALLSLQALIAIDVSTAVSVGELLDKITILQIKQQRIKTPSKQANITLELTTLEKVYTANVPVSNEIETALQELRTINESLWDLEDAIRLKESQLCHDETFKQIAATIIKQNDARARTKATINSLTNSTIVEEKSYKEMAHHRVNTSTKSVVVAIEIPFAELIDKITILEVKKENITDEQKLANIETELIILSNKRENVCTMTEELAAHTNALRISNRTMFHIQDAIREKIRSHALDTEFAHLARSVYITNDERCRIKRLINDLVGSHLVEEKEYTPYACDELLAA